MAEIVVDEMKKFPEFKDKADKVEFIVMDSDKYYGKIMMICKIDCHL